MIINLTQTSEGKKDRLKIIIRDAISFALLWTIIDTIVYIARYMQELENDTILNIILKNIIFVIGFCIVDYVNLKSKVKKYNSK